MTLFVILKWSLTPFTDVRTPKLRPTVTKHFTPWHYMFWRSLNGTRYLASPLVECPLGEILNSVQFEHDFSLFRYAFDCLDTNQDLGYETVANSWTKDTWTPEFLGKRGNIGFLSHQNLSCPARSFLASFRLEVNLETEALRYIYKCGKLPSGLKPKCQDRQSPMTDPEDFFLPTLEHHAIKCQPDEGLFMFKMGAKLVSLSPVIWYNFTCCSPPEMGNSTF